MVKFFVYLMAAMFLIGCAQEVREDHEYYKVDSNVKPAPPISNVMAAPAVQPVQPVYSSPIQPVQPVYSSPIQPVEPVYSSPVVVPQPTPFTPSQPAVPEWANQTIQATGQCAAPMNAVTPGQAKLMALKGAKVDAQRNLLERILGLRLDSSTVVKDMVTESDLINAQTSGFIRGARVVSENFDGSIATVVMEIPLYDNVYMTMKERNIYFK